MVRPPSPTKKPDDTKDRKVGEGLSDKTSDVLGSTTDLKQNLDNPDFKEKVQALSPQEKEELKTEIEKRKLETADNEQKERFEHVLNLLDKNEKEETHSSTASSKPTGTPLQTTGGKVIGRDGKIDVYKLPSGFEVHLDPQGRKTIDGQPLVVVGKEGATVMDGLFPASAFGLQVGTKGEISIDPKPSMLTVSGRNGPKINSAVPVIFNQKGVAFARQGVPDENGNQTFFWHESGQARSMSSAGEEIQAGVKLPLGLETKTSGNGQYLTVSAPAAEPLKHNPYFLGPNTPGGPDDAEFNNILSRFLSPANTNPLATVMANYEKTRTKPAQATPEVTPLKTSSASPRDSLTQSAVSASPCANGKCNRQAAPTTRRKVCTGRGCFYQ